MRKIFFIILPIISILLVFFTLSNNLNAEKVINEEKEKFNSNTEKYLKLTQENSKNPEYFYLLGRSYYLDKEWDKAISAYTKVLELQPNNPDALVGIAYSHMFSATTEEDLLKSEEEFLTVVKSHPDYTDAIEGLKRVREAIKKKKNELQAIKKIKKFEALTQDFSDNPEYHYELGKAYMENQEWEKAIPSFEKVLEQQPNNVDARVYLGYSLIYNAKSFEDLQRSEDEFRKTLAQSPDYKDAEEGIKKIQDIIQNKKKEFEQNTKRINEYLKLTVEFPNNSKYFFELGKAYLKENNWEKAARAFEKALKIDPGNPIYLYELGKAYMKGRKWEDAIATFQSVLKIQSENVDARLYLGYALMYNAKSSQDLLKSKREFQEVLRAVPDYKDAQEGIKKVNIYLFKQSDARDQSDHYYKLGETFAKDLKWNQAVSSYEKSLEYNPKNVDARAKLGYALLFSYNSKMELLKSKQEFLEVLSEVPSYLDAQEGLKRVNRLLHPKLEKKEITEKEKIKKELAGNLYEIAKILSDECNHCAAVEIYLKLVHLFPGNAEYFYELGREYSRLQMTYNAIIAFEQSLKIKPDYTDSLVGLGNQYLVLEDYYASRQLFKEALNLVPNNSDAWFGYARAEALLGYPCNAEEAYLIALSITPESLEILHSYASFLLSYRRYNESQPIFEYLAHQEGDFEKYRTTLFEIYSHTEPTLLVTAGYAQEREKGLVAPDVRKWVASLTYLNASIGLVQPINDCFRIGGFLSTLETKQKLLISGLTQYDVRSVSSNLKGEWFFGKNWTIVGDATFEWISNKDENALLKTQKTVLFEPSLVFHYNNLTETVVFGEITDSIIFRDFEESRVNVVTREAGFIDYRRDFSCNRALGADAFWLWYQDPIHNEEQRIDTWLQVGVPFFTFLTLKYQFEYRQFKEETNGYYSFEFQLTNWLKLRSSRRLQCGLRYEVEYWHGWRTTRGRNVEQQIVIAPDQFLPVRTVNYEVDNVYLTLGFNPNEYLDLSFAANYYHDTFDYTAYGIKMILDCKF